MNSYRTEYQRWLDSPALGNEEWQELSAIAQDDSEIESRFYAPLEFGTAGLRGVMGMGLSRMNIHVIRHATQCFAEFILSEGVGGGVVICYDCRINSELFAREAACVMAANGIKARLFDAMRPTPELSFAIRYHGAAAGINITASHNPKEYNGYKVYWSDGAQLPPQMAEAIATRMADSDIFTSVKRVDYDEAVASGMIELIGSETDEAFLEKVMEQAIDPSAVARCADELCIVYTPFHGAGRILVPEALRRLGVKKLVPVEEQMAPDGSFPTVESPNPENPEGFALAVKLANEVGAELIIGTDPDSDRVAVMSRDNGEYKIISGNQLGVLLLDYIINARRAAGTLPENAAALKTIVSSEMARRVAEANGVSMTDTFTGFKFIAEKIKEFEVDGSRKFIFGFEESIGYMIGDFVRDKDAVTTSVLVAEMCAHYHLRGMSLIAALGELYEKYGYFSERTLNLMMPGIDGLERMDKLMSALRSEPPAEIAGVKVVKLRDYKNGTEIVSGLGVVGRTEISGSNVLYFELADDTSFIVRPSGTEPKIKIYILAHGESAADCGEKLDKYSQFAQQLR